MQVKRIKFNIETKTKTTEYFEHNVEPDYNEIKKNEIREKRITECFPVINRGQLWYNMLSEAQLVELNTWYHAWLDATETLIIPEKPLWLVDTPEAIKQDND